MSAFDGFTTFLAKVPDVRSAKNPISLDTESEVWKWRF